MGLLLHSEEAENSTEEIAAATADIENNADDTMEAVNAEAENVMAENDEDIPLVSSSVVENTDTLNTIENINIDVENGVGIVTITTSFALDYEEIDKEATKYSLKLNNVILDDRLQVARDLSDFDTPLNFLSSFRDPLDETSVIIVAELKEQVEIQVDQDSNILRMKVGKTPEEKIAEELEEDEGEEDLWVFDIRSASVGGDLDKEYRGQLVSFDFKDADVRDVLRILADISGFNLIIHSGVRGNLTLRLANVPWDQAMDIVLEEKGLGAILEGNILKIAPYNVLNARIKQRISAAVSRESTKPLVTKQLFINYATAAELVPLIDSKLSGRGNLRIDTRTNSILLTDTESRIESVEQLIASLDIPEPQVLIESRIVQATLDFTRELGVQWGLNYRASAATGNPTGALFPSDVQVGGVQSGSPSTFGDIGNDFIVDFPAATGQGAGSAVGLILGSLTGAYDLDIRLSALETRGDGRILSSPKILTLNNQAASITQGVSIPFLSVSSAGTQTQFVDASLTLDVTPQVTNDDKILMELSVSDNAPDPATTGAGGQPGIRTNEASTNVIAGDGETVVIGGIFTRQASENFGGVPWFSRLPIFGMFFRNTQTVDQRRELLVFITPRIIR
ncbi:MAG: type IV pilus secretin PilQ [Candidatus Dadabacteria bacterium]|nr:type IV pilus secretin PilQ [Candidatus Dadabacteria bacterium]NIY22676.1 type IV pilus secretin PilQ [Candidatus Dadabacteria bacterium]